MDNNLQTMSLLKDFYNLTGARISIHDTDFSEIAAYPESLSPFCEQVQKNREVKKMCEAADRKAFSTVRESGEKYSYKCHCGLIETVAPIYHYGVLSGYFMMGQISDSRVDSVREIARLSSAFFDSRETLWNYVRLIPEVDTKTLQSGINIMHIISEYLSETHRVAPKSQELATGILHYIHRNYQKDLSVERLCEVFECSRTTLMNTFKKKYGVTLGRYINNYRLEQAEELLLKSDKSIKEITALCGFSEQNYFSKVFLKKYGVAPTQYRKNSTT